MDRLLRKPAAADADLASFLQAFQRRLSAPPPGSERRSHLDAIRTAVRDQQASRPLSLRDRVRALSGLTTAKVALAGAVAAAATGGAATGSLPGPVQDTAADIAEAVGIELARPGDAAPLPGSEAATTHGDEPAGQTGQVGDSGAPAAASERAVGDEGAPVRRDGPDPTGEAPTGGSEPHSSADDRSAGGHVPAGEDPASARSDTGAGQASDADQPRPPPGSEGDPPAADGGGGRRDDLPDVQRGRPEPGLG